MSAKKIFQELFSEINAVYDENEAKSIVYLLLEYFQGISKTDILLDNPLKKDFDYQEIIHRIQQHEPVQYIIGETEFYGRIFKVSPATLIPRPETEELVELTIHTFQDLAKKQLIPSSPKILDIGTGTGCIAISVSGNIQHSVVTAFDISEEALKMAKQNAELNEVTINFEKVDFLDESIHDTLPVFDIILSNPPYVMNLEKQEMEHHVLDFEPHLALFVEDENPLIFYKAIAKFAKKHLTENGFCIVEINQAFGIETADLFWKEGFKSVEVIKDFFGKDRMVKALL